MIFLKCFSFFSLIFLFYLNKCETKISLAIINVPGDEWKRDLRQNILRDKYGDACLKVVIRKCYKALMAARKKVCRTHFRCTSSFRSNFESFSKTGCIKEFDYTRLNNDNTRTYGKQGSNRSVNAARERFLDTCIPHMIPQYKKKNSNVILRNDIFKILVKRILRSHSEQRCQKLSRAKCIKACNYAKNEVCNKHACNNRRKRLFKKTCKTECKKEYIVRKKSSSLSSDSDSSKSD